MSQFYAKAEDEERCLQSSITRQPVMVQGLTTEGKLRPFSGTVQAVEKFCNAANPIPWLHRLRCLPAQLPHRWSGIWDALNDHRDSARGTDRQDRCERSRNRL